MSESDHSPYSRTPEYRTWYAMKSRCTKPNQKDYRFYGARGIKVCDRWLSSFHNFLEDMGRKPDKGYSIERIDVHGNYEPPNCRWATWLEQRMNKRRFPARFLTLNGKCQPLADWSREIGISSSAILARISKGWGIEDALTKPLRKKRKRKAELYDLEHQRRAG